MSKYTFLGLRPVELRYQVGKSTIYRNVASGLLPAPVRIGPNTSRWVEQELDEVDQARVEGATDEVIRTIVQRQNASRQVA